MDKDILIEGENPREYRAVTHLAHSQQVSLQITHLREQIEQYEFDDAAKPVLAKITTSNRALQALAEMALSDIGLSWVAFSCVQAVENAQTFELRLAKEEVKLRRLQKHDGSVRDLREFVNEVSAPPADSLSAWIRVYDEEKEKYFGALYEIERLIENRRMIAMETAPRIGATRKKSDKKAAENAGIGWLAASIKRITKEPHVRQTCILAEELFDIEEVSEDRLRGALRNFTDRDWRYRG